MSKISSGIKKFIKNFLSRGNQDTNKIDISEKIHIPKELEKMWPPPRWVGLIRMGWKSNGHAKPLEIDDTLKSIMGEDE